jgi:hypothetical protein
MLPAAQHHGHNPGHGGVTTTPRLPTIAATSSLPLASATANTILSQEQSLKAMLVVTFQSNLNVMGMQLSILQAQHDAIIAIIAAPFPTNTVDPHATASTAARAIIHSHTSTLASIPVAASAGYATASPANASDGSAPIAHVVHMVASVPMATNASHGTTLTALIPKVAFAPLADVVLSP